MYKTNFIKKFYFLTNFLALVKNPSNLKGGVDVDNLWINKKYG